MSDFKENKGVGTAQTNSSDPSEGGKKKKSALKKIFKITGITLGAVIALVLLIITIAVSYLKPERLTPLVEKYANSYLDADVKLGRIELSFWSTFPKLVVKADSLSIRSKALDSLPAEVRNQLPSSADSLLSIRQFDAALNIPKLFVGKIGLYDVIFNRPVINIVQATDKVSNLDIFPKTEEKSDTTLSIPDISLGTFRIDDGMPVRYFSLPDSTDISVTLNSAEIEGEKSPTYALEIQGLTNAKAEGYRLDNLSFGADGHIKWEHDNPYIVELDGFKIALDKVNASISSKLDFNKELTVNTLSFNLPLTPLADIMALIPEEMQGELAKVKPEASIALSANLTKPFTPANDSIPSLSVDLEIPEGKATYDGYTVDRLALNAHADIDGDNLDASTVEIHRLLAEGDGVSVNLEGTLTDLMTDPMADGKFKGEINVAKLPPSLTQMFPCSLGGQIIADSRFHLRKSYLNKDNFHRMRVDGDIALKNIRVSMPEMPIYLYTHDMQLKLGTNSSFKRGDMSVDSLLTVTLSIDTISADITGMTLQAKGLRLGAGCQNTASSADTALINPIGGRITADNIRFKMPEDSTRVRLSKASVGATLRRYKGDSKKPQLHLDVSAGRGFYADRTSRAMLRDALLFVTVHPSAPRTRTHNSSLVDSLGILYPNLSSDSIATLAKQIRKDNRRRRAIADSLAVSRGEVIDLGLDNSMSKLLRQWDAKGILKASRMRVFTPYFPLSNTVSNLEMRFTSDSVVFKDTRIKTGRSSFQFDGSISNITRALTSRNHSQPLKFNFVVKGDTVDINQIAAATFAGAAFAERDTALFVAPDTDNEQALQASVQAQASTDSAGVLIVPSNLDGNMLVTANNIIYSDLTFRDFKGRLNVYNGAINLERLGASTDVGSVNLNALYSAPSREEASFAFGMNVADLHIRQFLDLFPSLDSIMPLLSDMSGVINANVAATTDLDTQMNIKIPTLKAAVKIEGDSLVLIDQETFKKIGKWLLFKNKNRNVIDKMNVEMIINNSQLQMFPFIFDLDRYKLGVMGSNDMAMNLNYHIAVLKSPIPFKFGINVTGNIDNMKIRLGRAKFNEKKLPKTVAIADTTRINLVREIGNIFRRGVRNAKVKGLDFSGIEPLKQNIGPDSADTISRSDSLYFIKEGLLPAPDTTAVSPAPVAKKSTKK